MVDECILLWESGTPTSDELSDMTKDSVIDKFDALIAYADREINKL